MEAALYNIRLQREQIANRSVDLTWVFTQTLFMELNTVLWALSYPEVRKERPREEIEEYVQLAKDGIALASQRWPGVESALELYESLIAACLKVYDGKEEVSYVIRSPSSRPSRAVHYDAAPPALSSGSTAASSSASYQAPTTADSSTFSSYVGSDQASDGHSPSPTSLRDFGLPRHFQTNSDLDAERIQPLFEYTTAFTDVPFDPNSVYNTLPTAFPDFQHYGQGYGGSPGFMGNPAYYMPSKDENLYLGTIGDQYSQYLHAPYAPHQPLQSLSQEQQTELMTNLEKTGFSKSIPPGYKRPEFSNSYDQ